MPVYHKRTTAATAFVVRCDEVVDEVHEKVAKNTFLAIRQRVRGSRGPVEAVWATAMMTLAENQISSQLRSVVSG
jgi:hypothetical protein